VPPVTTTISDPRTSHLARLVERFPGDYPLPELDDWASVRQLSRDPDDHLVSTCASREAALCRLASGVHTGHLPRLVVDLRTGEAWHIEVSCRLGRRAAP
jgi:hypothetical protein